MTTAAPNQLTDFSAAIRAQIEAEVGRLITAIQYAEYHLGETTLYPEHAIVPTEVELGYMINCHHGRALYQEGDTICGLRVKATHGKWNDNDTRTITITVPNVEFGGEQWDEEKGKLVEVSTTVDVIERATW